MQNLILTGSVQQTKLNLLPLLTDEKGGTKRIRFVSLFLFTKDFRFSKLKKEEVAVMHKMEDDELILIEASLI